MNMLFEGLKQKGALVIVPPRRGYDEPGWFERHDLLANQNLPAEAGNLKGQGIMTVYYPHPCPRTGIGHDP